MIEAEVAGSYIAIAFLFGACVGLVIAYVIDAAAARAKKKLLDDYAKWSEHD